MAVSSRGVDARHVWGVHRAMTCMEGDYYPTVLFLNRLYL